MNKEFEVHKLNGNGIDNCNSIAYLFNMFLEELKVHCSEGREFSIAKTKLEEACFFAKKSVSLNPSNQDAVETLYTVPLHVGQNIEVPKGSKVTYY